MQGIDLLILAGAAALVAGVTWAGVWAARELERLQAGRQEEARRAGGRRR